MAGWLKLHRAFTDWEWYGDLNVRILFMHLLLTVNFEDKKWRGMTIKKGSRVTGRIDLARESGLSEQMVRTAIKKMQSTNDLTTENNPSGTMFTIVNWNKYQSLTSDSTRDQPEINQRATREQPESNQRATITKEVKNIRNKEIKEVGEKDFTPQNDCLHPVEKLAEYYLSQERVVSTICEKQNITLFELKKLVDDYTFELIQKGRVSEKYKEYTSYFINWMRAKKRDSPDKKSAASNFSDLIKNSQS